MVCHPCPPACGGSSELIVCSENKDLAVAWLKILSLTQFALLNCTHTEISSSTWPHHAIAYTEAVGDGGNFGELCVWEARVSVSPGFNASLEPTKSLDEHGQGDLGIEARWADGMSRNHETFGLEHRLCRHHSRSRAASPPAGNLHTMGPECCVRRGESLFQLPHGSAQTPDATIGAVEGYEKCTRSKDRQ